MTVSWLLACSAPPPRTANPTRPLDERRAIEVIVQTFREEGDQPQRGKSVQVAQGTPLEVDIQAKGRKYGVAYVTRKERQVLGKSLPPRNPSLGDALQLVRGMERDEDAHILLLYDSDYMYDDHLGSGRRLSTVTAERKLARDVRDFLVKARSEAWP